MKYSTASPYLPLWVELQNVAHTIFGRWWESTALLSLVLLFILTVAVTACRHPTPTQPQPQLTIEPLSFQVSSGEDHYQIEGFFAHTAEPGKMPALLVLNGDGGDARQCIGQVAKFAELRLRLACISLPGYGKSSGPSRF